MIGQTSCKNCGVIFKWRISHKEKPRKYCSMVCRNLQARKWLKIKFVWTEATPAARKKRMKENFERHVIRQNGCWDWNGSVLKGGYAIAKYETKQIPAHRFSWLLHKGEIPKGIWVLHTCDNRRCTNPEHLYLGTLTDNVKDMMDRKRNFVRNKLTKDQVIEIRGKLALGITANHLAKVYGVTHTCIASIKYGRTWKSI